MTNGQEGRINHPFGSVEFILAILEEAKTKPPEEVCERYSIRMAAYESWKRMYAHLSSEELEAIKHRVKESGRRIPKGGALAVEGPSVQPLAFSTSPWDEEGPEPMPEQWEDDESEDDSEE